MEIQEMFRPFDNYNLELDAETDEIYVTAWDSEAPHDTFHTRIELGDIREILETWAGQFVRL